MRRIRWLATWRARRRERAIERLSDGRRDIRPSHVAQSSSTAREQGPSGWLGSP
jgi:hypothetical protein